MSTYEIVQEGTDTIVGKIRAVDGATGTVPTKQADGTLLQAPGGGSGPQQVVVDVSSAEILDLFNTPKVLIPGVAGKVLAVIAFKIEYLAGATPYTDHGGSINVVTNATGGGTPQTTGFSPGAGLWDQATDQFMYQGFGTYNGGGAFPTAQFAGQDVILTEDVASPTLGDGTLRVTLVYFS